ncbi:MAG: VIT and VWA domain-containing protein, partial [Myxococcota bacterium]
MLPSLVAYLALTGNASAETGELVPVGPGLSAITRLDQRVDVLLENGFARTTVTQRFHNPNDRALEATYTFPLPEEASLSEMLVQTPSGVIRGEVVQVDRARQLYDDAQQRGADAALATKDSFRSFEFAVANLPADSDAVVRFVYYQPLDIDTGVARWVYPREPGGNDEGRAFWSGARPSGDLTVNVEVKSPVPVTDARMPSLTLAVDRLGPGHLKATGVVPADRAERDVVFYYRVADDQPGRVDVIPYRGEGADPGTFMVVVTPGMDLAPLEVGVDTVFLVDVSGSMAHLVDAVEQAVTRALPELRPQDRFRVVTFSSQATELVGWTAATPAEVTRALQHVQSLRIEGGTNLYGGLEAALAGTSPDRATSLVLITDAVANEGEVQPEKFRDLLVERDVRMFAFVMGNQANWPLMNVMTDATGGFATGVSNEDDLYGQIALARSKMGHAALHDARLVVKGDGIRDLTDGYLGKVFRGEQLVAFGHYDRPGPVTVTLTGRVSGTEQRYVTTAELPAVALDNPELERLWAIRAVQDAELARDRGDRSADETRALLGQIGAKYQIVTDETAMVALSDTDFRDAGVRRDNLARTALEHAAQDGKAGSPPQSHRVDASKPAFPRRSPSLGGG